METEPTTRDIMQKIDVLTDIVQSLATHMDGEFAKVRAEMATKDELASGLGKIRAEMATKDFVERRISAGEESLLGKILPRIDAVDRKVTRVVDILEEKGVLTTKDAQKVIVG